MTDKPNKTIIPLDTTERAIISRRTDEERERDRVIVARMYVRGKSLLETRDELNRIYAGRDISLKAVSLDLQAIRETWLRSAIMDFNAAKAKELARLDETEREAWDAWERSKEKHVRVEYEIADDQVPFSADKVADVKRKRRRKVIEATVGDIRYLQMVHNLIDARCKILGLYEPQRIQMDWRAEAMASGLDENTIDAVREKTIETLMQAIEQAAKDSGAIKEEDIIDVEAN